jgi:hypothetical protein
MSLDKPDQQKKNLYREEIYQKIHGPLHFGDISAIAMPYFSPSRCPLCPGKNLSP